MKKCIVICMTALSLSCLTAGCRKEESKTPENSVEKKYGGDRRNLYPAL